MKVILIEAGKVKNSAFIQSLRQYNHVVHNAQSSLMAFEILEVDDYDTVIINCQPGGEDGLDILKSLRNMGKIVPVIVLAEEDDADRCVEMLDNGADDYLVKPIRIQELMARVRALRRRNPEVYLNNEYQIGPCIFIPEQCIIMRGSEMISLKIKESMILEHLVRHSNKVVTREQLLQRIWGFNTDIEYNNIEVHISHLRKKLAVFELDSYIQTVRGIGYCLSELQVLHPEKIVVQAAQVEVPKTKFAF